jgi:ATP-dependent helicase HrpB
MAEARALLIRMDALDEAGGLTAHGRAMGELPLPPRLAHMVLIGAAKGAGRRAARIAALLTERGLGGRQVDLAARLDGFARDSSPRANAAAGLADRWARIAGRAGRDEPIDDGLLLAEAFPERIAKARGKPGEFQLVSGRGVILDPADALARETWLAIAELGGGDARDRVLLAARLDEAALMDAFAARMVREERLESGAGGKLRAKETLRLGRLVVEERLINDPDPALIRTALLDEVRRRGLAALPWGAASKALRARAAFLAAGQGDAPALDDEALMARLADWLEPLLNRKTSLEALRASDLDDALRGLIPWEQQRRLDAEAPARWTAPTGSTHAIDYEAEGGPRVDIRVQELFGLSVHPTVGRGMPLTLALLSPAHRPIQLTKDLPGFWSGSWSDVRKDMRGRYPKHVWPEAPATAASTTRAKPRG